MSKTKKEGPVPAKEVTLTCFELREAAQMGVSLLLQMKPTPAARLGMKIAKLARVLNDEVKEFVDACNDLVKQHGKKNEKGVMEVAPDNPKHDEWFEKYQDIGKSEITFSVRQVVLPPDCEPEPLALMQLLKFVTIRGDDDESEAQAGPTEVVKEK